MSRRIGIDTIHLRPTPRIGHTEYSAAQTASLVEAVVGRDDPAAFCQAWQFDLQWSTNDGPVGWDKRGRVTDMGHAVYAEGGVDKRETMTCPFEDPRDVLAFDAVAEYGLPDFAELVAYYEDSYQQSQARMAEQVVTGGYYKSVVSGAIHAFGWDMLLTAAADAEGFAKVLRSFAELTLHHVKAWAETSIEVFIQHDDMVWSEGPFMHPEFYRKVIFPEYKRFWDVLHAAGKKVLYCSDGRWDMFMDDIAAAGADGFIFEPFNDFAEVVRRFGKTRCIVGSGVDCRTMTFGTWEQVQAEMDRTLALAGDCAGLIWAVGNHIPSNVPIEMATRYMAYLRENWGR